MNLKKAINVFSKEYPDKIIIGYWNDSNGVVIKVQDTIDNICVANCFYCKNDGNIYIANPLLNPIILQKPMILI